MSSAVLSESGPDAEPATVDILIVDDEVRNLDVLESILTSPSYHLVRAQNAQEALMALMHGEFAVIVLDIQMPVTNGIELANLIKQRKRTQHIPIIFLTAYFNENKDILQGYEVGAVDYLTKPLAPQILRSKIGVFVELFRKNRELVSLNHAMETEIAQREVAEEALRQAKDGLESRVEERTAELTKAVENLAASERRYRQMVRNLPAAVYTTDAQGRVTLYNEAAAGLWGQRPEIGTDLWCGSYRLYRVDGTALALDECPMAVTLRTGRAARGAELIIERPDGVRREVLAYPDPIYDASGTLTGAVNLLLDVTDSKRAEEASRRLAAIVESSTDAIISKDLNGIIRTWNRGAERLFGYTEIEAVGKPITLLIPPERRGEEADILGRIRRGERVEHYETVRQRKDGSLVEISLTVSPIRNALGDVVGASKIVRDITAQKQTARELERAHQAVIAASRAKDDFLAVLSHELRTPLNPVLLVASEAARDASLPAAARRQFADIRKHVELQARLIDDLLDLTGIRHGKLSLNLSLVDMHDVLKDAFETIRSEFQQKSVLLAMELKAERSRVKGDALRLQQVIWNLLKNAIKFTSTGGSVVVATRTNDRTRELLITVTDTGIGMTRSELARVFDAFAQGEHADEGSRRFGGLGLGLSISRTLVEAHSGSIGARSEGRNSGSTFTIKLPLAADQTLQSPSPAAESPRARGAAIEQVGPIGILLIEDHEPTRCVLQQLLARRGYHVTAAATIAEARALSLAHRFQLVISDIGLPDGDGIELMREMRAANQKLQGIALTGYGMNQDIARSREAGFMSHLLKPVRLELLDEALSRAIEAIGR